MKLYDILEPDDKSKEHKVTTTAIGIDLGTTNSLAAIYADDEVVIIPNQSKQSNIVKSIVGYINNKAIVGEDAKDLPQKITSPKRLLTATKAREHQNIIEQNGAFIFKIGNKLVTPIEALSLILKQLKQNAEDFLNQVVEDAVITVPAYFDEPARQATRQAAELAGLNVLRLLNEPTAAAVAYGLDKNPTGVYGIYDLGGGTFDISILKMRQGMLQVLAINGDHSLGGDDFDLELANFLSQSCNVELSYELISKANQAKEQLSYKDEVIVCVNNKEIVVSKSQFENLVEKYVARTIELFEAALKDAELTKDDLKEVIMVGGSSRTPAVIEAVSKFIGKPPMTDINPEEIVAAGAAVQAANLTIKQQQLLLDVIPLSLGIELADGTVEKIIYRNSPIPISKSMLYTNQQDSQTAFIISVMQGESDFALNCRSIAKFEVKINPMPRNTAKIQITMQVDVDGLLTVTAKDIITNITQEVVARPSYGLSEDEIISLLKA